MLVDLHVHTVKGGPDSNLTPQDLVKEAKRLGLDVVCVTEHGGGWDKEDFKRFAREQDILMVRGLEVDTDLGHIAAFGLDRYVSGIHRAETLRRIVDDVGGFMVLLHPFRRYFERPPLFKSLLFKRPVALEEAIQHPVFHIVDAVEVVNGACTERENRFALEVSRRLSKLQTGGSDAHSINGLGCCLTVFERQVTTQEAFLQELRAGRFYPAHGLLNGHVTQFA